MRIVHTESNGGKGGQPLRIIDESLGLLQRGHHVTILCPKTAPLYALAKKKEIDIVAMPLKQKNLYTLKVIRDWMSENQKRVDIINSHNSIDTWLVALANLTLPNPIPLVRTRHASGMPRNNWTTRWLFRKACACVVTTGEKLRQQIEDIGVPIEKSISVPSGVDIHRFHPINKKKARICCRLSQNYFWIGVVSYLRPNKGHRTLLRAFSKINNSHIKLVIVGEGEYKKILKKEIVALGIQNRTKMVGHQRNPEFWFSAFDIAISPSCDMEGLPQSVLQSLASRITTIATNAGSTSDAVINGKTGILIPQHDEVALKEAIITLYNNQTLRERLAQQGYEHLRAHFTRNHMLDAMEKIFFTVIQHSKSR